MDAPPAPQKRSNRTGRFDKVCPLGVVSVARLSDSNRPFPSRGVHPTPIAYPTDQVRPIHAGILPRFVEWVRIELTGRSLRDSYQSNHGYAESNGSNHTSGTAESNSLYPTTTLRATHRIERCPGTKTRGCLQSLLLTAVAVRPDARHVPRYILDR